MNVGDLSLERFAAQLADEGVAIRWGPFVSRIVSKLPELAAPIHLLYADFPIEPPGGICDFHVCLRPRPLHRSWSASQAEFLLDHEQPFEPFPRRTALAMLEWGLNWCVYQLANQFMIIHAAVVARKRAALLLPGWSGIGKSTLCAGMVSAGWRLLSDELALVNPTDGLVRGSARPISLKNESIDVIRTAVPKAVLGPRTLDTVKGAVAHMKPPRESVLRADEAARPRWIVIPRFAATQTLQLFPLSKGRAFLNLSGNAFNYALLGAVGFRAMARLVDGCDCYRLTYSALEEAVTALDDLVALPAGSEIAASGRVSTPALPNPVTA